MLHVDINAVFLEDQSIVEENIYLWAYHIKIKNKYDQSLVIKKRFFEVVDIYGQRQSIEGIGVANQEPCLKPGEIFEYASGVLLNAPSGFFAGCYIVELSDGSLVEEVIPNFSLDSKYDISKIQ
ncbi:MAG: ApaG domain [Candidatus Woesearchaeota archaeon]|jgi:ApaG protein